MDTKKALQTAGGVALSLGLLFVTVWVVAEAWKTGTKEKTA